MTRFGEAETRARETLALARERHADVYVAFALQHLAAIATLRSPSVRAQADNVCSRAARILGFSDARIEKSGSVLRIDERPIYDRTLTALREAIGGEAVATLMAEGAAMTEEQAVQEALAL